MARVLGEIERVDLEFNEKHPRGEKGTSKGGEFVRKGEEGSGTKTGDDKPATTTTTRKTTPSSRGKSRGGGSSGGGGRPGRKKKGGGKAKTKRRTPPPMSADTDNDPARVKRLQKLLRLLGLAPGGFKVDGIFGAATTAAVKALQRKMGMRESGRVSNTLLNKLDLVAKLSPCVSRAELLLLGDWPTITRADLDGDADTGAMIALVPAEADAGRLAVEDGEAPEELHATLIFLGEADEIPPETRQTIVDRVRAMAESLTLPLPVEAFSVAIFNPESDERDPCLVLGLTGEGIDHAHTLAAEAVTDLDIPEQHRPWTAHLTLAYTDDASLIEELTDRTGPITFDRIRAAFGDEVTDIPLRPPATVARAYTTPREADMAELERAQMSSAAINDLPDSAFAYIEPGGDKDESDKTVPRSLRHFPIHDEAHVRNALSRAPQSPFGDKAMPKIRAAAKKYGIEVSDDEQSRSEEVSPVAEILRYERCWPLDDILIRSGGDGRTVEAYAAVFDVPSEIRDQHGHYLEVIDRKAFNRAISHGIERVGVFYHHGMTLHGTPSDLGSVPIGSPVDIRADAKGLRTVTRYNKSQLADSVLEAIRNNDIRGYSFRGRVFQSNPAKVPRARGGTLPTITRTELGLSEYGPTPTPAYADAGILAVRSVQALAAHFAALEPQERSELARLLAVPTPPDPDPTPAEPETPPATPDVGPGTEDSPEIGRSGRKDKLAAIMAQLHAKGIV